MEVNSNGVGDDDGDNDIDENGGDGNIRDNGGDKMMVIVILVVVVARNDDNKKYLYQMCDFVKLKNKFSKPFYLILKINLKIFQK